jgi:hypothetical protein
MQASIIAQVATEHSEIQTWLLVAVPLLGALVGVWLGSRLDRNARKEERRVAERVDLRKDASDLIGTTRVVLTDLAPDGYALWAREELYAEIAAHRNDLGAMRRRLASLAVRWPEAAAELNAVEHYLGAVPIRLTLLVEMVLDDKQHFTEHLSSLKEDHAATIDALDRAILLLKED